MIRAILQHASDRAGLIWPFAPADPDDLQQLDRYGYLLRPMQTPAERRVERAWLYWTGGRWRLDAERYLRHLLMPACWLLGHRWWMSGSMIEAGRRVVEVRTCRRCARMVSRSGLFSPR